MLNKSKVNQGQSSHWCIVSGSEVWLIEGQLPFGKSEQWGLPVDKAIEVGRYNNHPVMWLNEADLNDEYSLTSLRDCLHFPELVDLFEAQ